jgi:hypothetical protein
MARVVDFRDLIACDRSVKKHEIDAIAEEMTRGSRSTAFEPADTGRLSISTGYERCERNS